MHWGLRAGWGHRRDGRDSSVTAEVLILSPEVWLLFGPPWEKTTPQHSESLSVQWYLWWEFAFHPLFKTLWMHRRTRRACILTLIHQSIMIRKRGSEWMRQGGFNISASFLDCKQTKLILPPSSRFHFVLSHRVLKCYRSDRYNSECFRLCSIDSVSLKAATHENCRTKYITHFMKRRSGSPKKFGLLCKTWVKTNCSELWSPTFY